MSRAVSRRPAVSSTSPSLKSRPARRTQRPRVAASVKVTEAPSALRSLSSWMMMLSAPGGSGAPVKMRAHSPSPSGVS
jgi:hypothetical protein